MTRDIPEAPFFCVISLAPIYRPNSLSEGSVNLYAPLPKTPWTAPGPESFSIG